MESASQVRRIESGAVKIAADTQCGSLPSHAPPLLANVNPLFQGGTVTQTSVATRRRQPHRRAKKNLIATAPQLGIAVTCSCERRKHFLTATRIGVSQHSDCLCADDVLRPIARRRRLLPATMRLTRLPSRHMFLPANGAISIGLRQDGTHRICKSKLGEAG